MSQPITLPTVPSVLPAVAAPAAPVAPPAPVSPTPAPAAPVNIPDPVATTPVLPPKTAESLEDAISRRLREESLLQDEPATPKAPVEPAPAPVQQTPPAPPAAPQPSVEPDEAALAAEISATTEKMTPQQREAFTKKTYELRDYRRQVKELAEKAARAEALEAQLKEAQEAAAKIPTAPADYETLKAEAAALRQKFEQADKEVAAVRLEQSDLYKREIAEPLAAVESEVAALAKRYDLSAEDMATALASPSDAKRSRALSDLAADMPAYDQQKFWQQVDKYDTLRGKREGLLANAQASLSQMTAEATARQQAAAQKATEEYRAAAPKAWDDVASAAALAPVEGNEAWNNALAAAREFPTKYSFEAFDTPSQAGIMSRAAAYPLLVGSLQSAQARLAEAEATISKLRGATPAAGGGTPPAAAAPQRATASLSFEDAIVERMRSAGQLG